MHQIRVHLAASGFPILGDKLYSGDGAEYLEWMETGWTPELENGDCFFPVTHSMRPVSQIFWNGKSVRWVAEMARDMVEFSAGGEISLTPDVVIWSRHD